MPMPSSLTRMSDSPPATVTISIVVAPASIAFSISSLTTLAGRSITSAAAMRLIVSTLSWRMGTVGAISSALAKGRYARNVATRSRVITLASSTAG